MDVRVSFLQLPVELICDILQLLSVKNLLQCNLVCKRLRRIIYQSSALLYSIELSRCRMRSAMSSDLSFATRLQNLRDRENAWRTLNLNSRHKLKLAHSGTVYEFAGGVYGTGKEIDRRTAYITFYDLPSVTSGAQRSITHTFSDINVVDFTMDPAQDLLVLVSINLDSQYIYDLHLHTLSTNEPHPLAPAPILPCYRKEPGLNLTDGAIRIQISGDTIGFLVKEAFLFLQAHFEVFKWRAVFPNSCIVKSIAGIDDFTFLSQDHFLLVQPDGLFNVYSFSDPISNPLNPILRASYELPNLSPAYNFWYISLSSNPAPCVPGPTEENKAYYCSPSDRLHACCIYVYQPALPNRDTVYPFVFFFHPKTLLDPPNERKHSSGKARMNIFSPWQGSNTVDVHDDNAPSHSTLDNDSPIFSDLPSFSTSPSVPSSPHVSPPSSASSVSLDGPSSDLLNFPTPQTIHTSPSSMLFDISPSHSSRTTLSKAQCQFPVPWDAWGPQNTRWFREHLSKDWQRSIYGLRTADCVVDRAALESLIHHNGYRSAGANPDVDANDSDSDSEVDGGDESDEDGFIFINEVAFSVGDIESQLGCTGTLPKFLRVRDFNPYSISKVMEEITSEENTSMQNPPSTLVPCAPTVDREFVEREINRFSPDMVRDQGGHRRVVTEPTNINVRGVFTQNIVSWLPYVEAISQDTFNVNEVMMDDSRLLLIKRGRGRKLVKTINILTL
ncbi:hypothetical protein J3R30DRAFT_3420148 [Lentinula aciculospora]|uniref:F-box domain-containing protein n=1 Tax=Lentinula aciculospora TaxID=153920 RepID=A0A9W9AV06_9AGAR|nr:hypothetical protein J3R30DRAFT_3420148 [Lentinula aciculospora]